MKLSEIAIKVTNRNRKSVIAWLENVCPEHSKPSDYPEEDVHSRDVFLQFLENTARSWGSRQNINNKTLVTLSKAKRIYEKENRPQPTHEQLKSERGRSAMYKMKYEQLRKDYDFDTLTFGKSLERTSELNEEVSILKRKLKTVKRESERTNEQLVKEKQQMVIANGKTIKELDLYKERVVELEDKNDTLVQQNMDLVNEKDNLKSISDKKSKRIEQLENSHKKLYNNLLSSEETIKENNDYIDVLVEEKRVVTARLSASNESINELKERLQEVEDDRLSKITYLRKVSKNLLIASTLLVLSLVVSLVYILK